MKSLVIFGAQNDLVSFVNQADYCEACSKLESLVKDKFFDKIYYYELEIYDPDGLLKKDFRSKICQPNSLGALTNWKANVIGSYLEKEPLNNIKIIKCTVPAEAWMELPYVSMFEPKEKLFLAGNLSLISRSVSAWKSPKNVKVLSNGVWLGSRNWQLILSFEYRDIDFYSDTKEGIVKPYKQKYLEQYYPNLILANV